MRQVSIGCIAAWMIACALMRSAAATLPHADAAPPAIAPMAQPAPPPLDPAKAITQYVRDAWQTHQGLPQNSVQAIAQTDDGYLWLGTEEGLARFDGVRFSVFDRHNTAGLRSNLVRGLLVDRSGDLWIGSSAGVLLRYRRGEIMPVPLEAGIVEAEVRAILEDSHGRIWVGTRGAGLLYVDGGRLRRAAGTERLPGQRVEALAEARDGVLWIGTDNGLARLQAGRLDIVDGLLHPRVFALAADRSGALWIGTQGGLNRLQDGVLHAYTRTHGLSNELILALLEDRAGTLWIGTRGGGLNRYRDGRFSALDQSQGLTNAIVTALQQDREGSLWVGTLGGGLNRLRDGRFTALTTWEGLSNNFTRAFHESADGSLWIGTDGGGVNRVRGDAVTAFSTAQGLSNSSLYALAPSRDGGVWVGTRGGGVNLIAADGRITMPHPDPGLAVDIVMTLHEDRAGSLWIGTLGSGLKRLQAGRLIQYTRADGLADLGVYAIDEAADGSLWIGTLNGLSHYANGGFTNYGVDDGLSSPFIKSLYRDAAQVLWLGTQGGGLNRLKNGRIGAVTTEQGLFDDTVHSIVEDDFGQLWMSSNKGVFRVAKAELDAVIDGRLARVESIAYGTADGMRSAECNTGSPSGLKTRDGRLWFATLHGAVVVDPRRLPQNPHAPPVLIERIVADGHDLPTTGPVQLAPGLRTLELHYTAPSLLVPERVQFKYRLGGFDPAWVDAGTRRIAYFTNLAHGDYQFRVIASNNDGVWNATGAGVDIHVAPYVSETWWFRTAAALGIAALLALGFRMRIAQIRARAQRLQAMVEARTTELQSANAELRIAHDDLIATQQQLVLREKMASLGILTAGVAHEINNPANFADGAVQELDVELRRLHGFLRELAGGDADPEVMAAIAARFERLAAMTTTAREGHARIKSIVRDLRQFTRLDEADRKRVPIAEPIQSTVNLVRTRFDRIDFQLQLQFNPTVECQPAKLGQVFMNLIVNACEAVTSHRFDAPGWVRISSTPGEDCVVIEIADNGSGMSDTTLERVFEPFFTTKDVGAGTGLGLAVSFGIVREHAGRIDVASTHGEGSCFRVTLPC